jgi:MarR-like DNA-binding transcriptional regulator SgrR of sgrS sRNA
VGAKGWALLVVCSGLVWAASRPHYGGTLRVELHASLANLDPAEAPRDAEELAARARLIPAVFETLVRLNERGVPEPWLATQWMHDVARTRWVFTPRTGVMLHNGTVWSPPGGTINIPDDRPIEQILRTLAQPRNAVVVRGADGVLVGTGPFRVAQWSGSQATLAAHDGYWAGRPYLDAVEIQFGRSLRDQSLDLETGKADVSEAALTDLKRLAQRGLRTSAGARGSVVLALVFDNAKIAGSTREALALAIDRGTIQKVLLQGIGEESWALLPRWLSGYSFVFARSRDVGKAKQLAGGSQLLGFAYDRQDAALRPVAERIAVNASEAGISMRPGSQDVTLVRLPVTSVDEWNSLEDLASMLKTALPAAPSLYETERALMENARVVPLFHVPEGWAWNSRVRNWPGANWADLWIDPVEKQ